MDRPRKGQSKPPASAPGTGGNSQGTAVTRVSMDIAYLGELLAKRGLITQAQKALIMKAAPVQQQKLEKIRGLKGDACAVGLRAHEKITPVDVIASMGLETEKGTEGRLDEEAIMRAVAEELEMPFKRVDPLELDLEVVTQTIPKSFALKHLVLAVEATAETLTVVVYDPFNRQVLEDIERVVQKKIQVLISTKSDILKTISEFYGFKRSIVAADSQLSRPLVDLGNLEQLTRVQASGEISSSDQHITNAVDHLFSYAFDQRASDVHIEPKREQGIVRLRIDGTLHTIYRIPKSVHPAIISRIKGLGRLDLAEKRRPQDGRIKVERNGKEAEIRLSTVPVAFGEKAVLRVLDPDILLQDLEGLGFSSAELIKYRKLIGVPHGIVLITGPTGSGKSTTLYSSLRYLASEANNITTVEDPIEMVHEQFNQIAVQPQINLTFGNILRHILRQDPDIIMIGEMRDLETATNAIQAALTGHLVLSTLHTNDAPSAITRLIDLGVQPFLISSTIVGVVAQRLVRKICPHCVESYRVKVADLAPLSVKAPPNRELELKVGKGCRQCRNTGYLGRTSIFEVVPMDDRLRELTTKAAPLLDLQKAALAGGMRTLQQSAIDKMLRGITTLEEVLRVTVGEG
ncbi:MAG TPA: GspE/PulE family protein [Syntrophobacteria bacterium]|nr:GspE/PulE family protein [Syntrophobacteria bacterium]